MELTIPPPGIAVILLTLVLGAAVYDIRYRRIRNWLTASGVVSCLAMNAFLYQGWPGLRLSLAGMGLAFGLNIILYILHFRGAGDVKLMAAIGAMTGWQNWVGIFAVSAVIGGVLAIIVVILRKRLKATFWNVGFLMNELKSGRSAHLKREELDVNSAKAARIPGGAVTAIGTLFFLAASMRFH